MMMNFNVITNNDIIANDNIVTIGNHMMQQMKDHTSDKRKINKQNEMKMPKLMWLIKKKSTSKKIQGHCCNNATMKKWKKTLPMLL